MLDPIQPNRSEEALARTSSSSRFPTISVIKLRLDPFVLIRRVEIDVLDIDARRVFVLARVLRSLEVEFTVGAGIIRSRRRVFALDDVRA